MSMNLPIDLDSEAVQYEGTWYTRDELARRIKSMLDAGDFAIAKPSQALEELTAVVSTLRTVAFRATEDLAEGLNALAAKQGKTPGLILRELLASAMEAGAQSPPRSGSGGGSARLPTPPPVPAVAPVAPTFASTLTAPAPAAALTAPAPPAVKPIPLVMPSAAASTEPALPSVVVDSTIVTESATSEEAAGAVNLTAKKKEDEDVERRWFGG